MCDQIFTHSLISATVEEYRYVPLSKKKVWPYFGILLGPIGKAVLGETNIYHGESHSAVQSSFSATESLIPPQKCRPVLESASEAADVLIQPSCLP